MQYVQESLSPGEKILKISHYHWIYVCRAAISASIFFLLALVLIFLGIMYHYYDIFKLPPWLLPRAAAELGIGDYLRGFPHTNILIRAGAFILFLTGLLQIAAAMLVVATTEIAVTSKRVVLKRGLVSRKVEQMRTDFIEGDDVNQTVMGRILDYGQIKIFGTGTEHIILPRYTVDPIGFRRAIQMARNISVQQAEQALQQAQNLPPGKPAVVPPAISPMMPPFEPR